MSVRTGKFFALLFKINFCGLNLVPKNSRPVHLKINLCGLNLVPKKILDYETGSLLLRFVTSQENWEYTDVRTS